jgi:hypothetical protein
LPGQGNAAGHLPEVFNIEIIGNPLRLLFVALCISILGKILQAHLIVYFPDKYVILFS